MKITIDVDRRIVVDGDESDITFLRIMIANFGAVIVAAVVFAFAVLNTRTVSFVNRECMIHEAIEDC
jgi:hypothetical protein